MRIEKLRANVERLGKADGVVGVLAVPLETTAETLAATLSNADTHAAAGDTASLAASLAVLLSTTDPEIRVVLNHMTIHAVRESGAIIAAAIGTGHAVAKSLRRMLRRVAPC